MLRCWVVLLAALVVVSGGAGAAAGAVAEPAQPQRLPAPLRRALLAAAAAPAGPRHAAARRLAEATGSREGCVHPLGAVVLVRWRSVAERRNRARATPR